MTSYRQIEANRRNALKSTGPKTAAGKEQSRCNAVRHGLTAETVIGALEDAEDYKAFEAAIIADYDAQSGVEREFVLRLITGFVSGSGTYGGSGYPVTTAWSAGSQLDNRVADVRLILRGVGVVPSHSDTYWAQKSVHPGGGSAFSIAVVNNVFPVDENASTASLGLTVMGSTAIAATVSSNKAKLKGHLSANMLIRKSLVPHP
jgi:hypothetical protein